MKDFEKEFERLQARHIKIVKRLNALYLQKTKLDAESARIRVKMDEIEERIEAGQ